MKPLAIKTRLTVQAMRHGAGFLAQGIRGDAALMDPYLMADHYWMTQPTFGPHPHAGFSAVTYMFDDAQTGFSNRDSLGDSSLIRAGDVHWTIAGRGVVHDEVPIENGKTAHGLQLFVNLAAANKHRPPGSIHVAREDIPVVSQAGGARIKVAFGEYDDGNQRVEPSTELPTKASLFDISLDAGKSFSYPVPADQNIFLLVIKGELTAAGASQDEIIKQGDAVAFERGGGRLTLTAAEAAQVALFMGVPLNEPVVRHGPFAMTNQADIERAIADYQAGRMGQLAPST
jgi:redox-sensitive bicupin YhaK (pirin superfamily)